MPKELPQRKRLAAIFASFAVLGVGTLSLTQSMTIDYYSVINTVQKIIPASIALGSLGWVMGMILDRPKRKNQNSALNLSKMLASSSSKEESIDDSFSIDDINNQEGNISIEN